MFVDPEDQYRAIFRDIFSLQYQQFISSIRVFDDYAIVRFEDHYVLVANRPEKEGVEIAQYAYGDSVIGDEATDFLYFGKTPITRFAMTPVTGQSFYVLTFQTLVDNKPQVLQYSFSYDYEFKYGTFRPFGEPINIPFKAERFSADAVKDLIVAGCTECNDGFGEIYFLDVRTGATLNVSIKGNKNTGKRVGRNIKIQPDEASSGWRIWYSTEDKLVVASLIKYGSELVLEDEIFSQETDPVISNIALKDGNFLVIVDGVEKETNRLLSFTACPSGYEYLFSEKNSQKDRKCESCPVGFYSVGYNQGCKECSMFDRAQAQYYFETNLIDKLCFSDYRVVDVSKEWGIPVPLLIIAVIVVLVATVISILVGVRRIRAGQKCLCFGKQSKKADFDKPNNKKGVDKEDFDDLRDQSTAEKKKQEVEMEASGAKANETGQEG